eukprot:m.90322 g.90322  ORF g.90322 m.90322 type:complete len:105 (-) comp11837_c0_seq1:1398-1712(-)
MVKMRCDSLNDNQQRLLTFGFLSLNVHRSSVQPCRLVDENLQTWLKFQHVRTVVELNESNSPTPLIVVNVWTGLELRLTWQHLDSRGCWYQCLIWAAFKRHSSE